MLITRIKTPKFKVGRYTLNEYELRQLQLEVAQGNQQVLKYDLYRMDKLYNKNGHMDRTFGDNSGYDVGPKYLLKWRINKNKDELLGI
jgi:hypothetical protein